MYTCFLSVIHWRHYLGRKRWLLPVTKSLSVGVVIVVVVELVAEFEIGVIIGVEVQVIESYSISVWKL